MPNDTPEVESSFTDRLIAKTPPPVERWLMARKPMSKREAFILPALFVLSSAFGGWMFRDGAVPAWEFWAFILFSSGCTGGWSVFQLVNGRNWRALYFKLAAEKFGDGEEGEDA